MVELGESGFAKRAAEFKAKGEAALKGGFFSNLTKSKSDRMDEAKEYFQQAANCYKHSHNHRAAMEMYLRCAECEDQESFRANFIRDAAIIIKNQDTESYMKLIKQAIELY